MRPCVWRIADSGEISNSPHTGSLVLRAAACSLVTPVISILSFSQTPGRSLRRSPVGHVPPSDRQLQPRFLSRSDRSQRRAERNSDFRSTMAALGGSPVRFHLAKSRNCGLLRIPPKRTEGLRLLAGARGIRNVGVARNLCEGKPTRVLEKFRVKVR